MTPRVLLLGGIDPSGGAGLTVDATVIAACGAHSLPVPVALTVQSRRGFRELVPVAADVWLAALREQLLDAPVQAIKIGLVGSAANVRAIATALHELAPLVPIVVDPVLSATAGGFEPASDLCAAYRDALLPLAALATPNVPELAALGDGDAARLLASGCGAVLSKGGHGDDVDAVDRLVSHRGDRRSGDRHWVRPRLATGPVRGTGCALASAIAAHLAHGDDLATAVGRAGDELAGLLAALPAPTDGLPRPLPLAAWPRRRPS